MTACSRFGVQPKYAMNRLAAAWRRASVVDIEAKISALPFGTKAQDFRNTVDRLWFAHTYQPRADADAAWRNACAALRQNAGAELPSE